MTPVEAIIVFFYIVPGTIHLAANAITLAYNYREMRRHRAGTCNYHLYRDEGRYRGDEWKWLHIAHGMLLPLVPYMNIHQSVNAMLMVNQKLSSWLATLDARSVLPDTDAHKMNRAERYQALRQRVEDASTVQEIQHIINHESGCTGHAKATIEDSQGPIMPGGQNIH